MPRCYCPICLTEYEENPKVCSCGFEGIEYPFFENDEQEQQFWARQLFAIYKFTKKVYYKKIDFPPSELTVMNFEENHTVDWVNAPKGLVIVDCIGARDGTLPTVASEGMLAFRVDTKALILNVDRAAQGVLDESRVRVLFLGKDFGGFSEDSLIQYSGLRYIFVDEENPHFSADDHVLFNKNKTRLVAFASLHPATKYTVPRTVKSLADYSFFYPRNLKRLYLPKGIRIERHSLQFHDNVSPEIVYY